MTNQPADGERDAPSVRADPRCECDWETHEGVCPDCQREAEERCEQREREEAEAGMENVVWYWHNGRREQWEVIGVNGVNPTWLGSTVNLRRGVTTIHGVSTLPIAPPNPQEAGHE